MRPTGKLAVIGAMGRLGAPVAAKLARHFDVKVIIRSPDKARKRLPANVEIVQGDLRNIPGLRAALEGVDVIYLNFSIETMDLNLPFYEECEGAHNLMTTIQGLAMRYVANIGALICLSPGAEDHQGQHDTEHHPDGRAQDHRRIRYSAHFFCAAAFHGTAADHDTRDVCKGAPSKAGRPRAERI